LGLTSSADRICSSLRIRAFAALLSFRHYQQMNFMALLGVFQQRSGTAGFDIIGMGPYGKDLSLFSPYI